MEKVAVTAACCLSGREFEVPPDLSAKLRRADLFVSLAAACGRRALELSPPSRLQAEKTGVFIGTAYGPLETNLSSLGSLIDHGERQISPTLFSHSVYNAAAGYISRLFDIHGPALTVTTYAWPFLTALSHRRLSIVTGRISRALVLAVETYGRFLDDAYNRCQKIEAPPCQPGAVAVVLEKEQTSPQGLCALGQMEIVEKPCDPKLLLTRDGEEWSGKGLAAPPLRRHESHRARHPLAHAQAAVQAMASAPPEADSPWRTWRFEAPFGFGLLNIGGEDKRVKMGGPSQSGLPTRRQNA